MRAPLLRCPYCMEGFGPGDAITSCSRCSAIHHKSCWRENGHCTVFACNGSQTRPFRTKGWIDFAPAILLLLLATYPVQMIALQFLWLPSIICCTYSTAHLFLAIVRPNYSNFNRSAIAFSLNIAAITTILLQIFR